MANFNDVVQPIQTPDQTRDSQGYKDDALGGLFSGIADDFQMGVKATDDFLKRRVEDSARDMVEPLRDAAIANVAGVASQAPPGSDLGGPTSTQYVDPETGEVSSDSPSQLPGEAQAQFSRLSNIKQGVKAGSLSDSYYRSQLDVASKRLRRLYPGYEDEIDNSIEKLTGSVPANKLLADLQSQASAAISSQAGAQNKITAAWLKGAFNGYFDSRVHPLSSMTSIQDVADLVSPRAKAKASQEIDSSNMANNKAHNTEYKEDTEIRSNNGASNIVTGILSDLQSAGGNKSFGDLQAKIAKMPTDQPWTKEELVGIQNLTSQLEVSTRGKLNAYYNAPFDAQGNTRASLLGPEKTKAQIDAQVARVTDQMGAYRDKNTGQITHNNAMVKMWESGAQAETLKDPDALQLKIINDNFGGTVAGYFLSRPEGAAAMGAIGTLSHDHAMLGVATGKYSSLNDAINDSYNPKMTPEQRKAVGDNLVKDFQGALHSDEVPAVLKNRTIRALYGPENEGMIKSNVPLFEKMGDPTTLADIKKHSEATGQPELWNMAKNWVLKTGTGLAMTQAVQMQNALVYNKNGTIVYHPDTHEFEYKSTKDGITDPSLNDIQTLTANTVQKLIKDPAAQSAVTQYNKMINGMATVFKLDNPKASNEDTNIFVTNLTKSLGVDLGAAKQPDGVTNFFGAMNEAAQRAFPKGALYGPNGFFHPDGQGGIQLTYTRSPTGEIIPRPRPGDPTQINPSENGSIGAGESNLTNAQVVSPETNSQTAVGGRGGARTSPPAGRMPLGASDLTAEGLPAPGQGGSSQPQYTVPSEPQLAARAGIIKELNDLHDGYMKATDPEIKADYRQMMKDRQAELAQLGGQGAEGAGNFKPRGNPTAVNTPETQAQGKAGLDALTGIPSLVDAVKSGDPKEITKQGLLAAATIIPFPAGKVGKVVDKVIEGGATLIASDAVEFARAAKGMANEGPKGIPSPEELSKLSDSGLDTIRKLAVEGMASKNVTAKEADKLNQFLEHIDNELINRNGVPYTKAMDKLDGLREEALTQKLSSITDKNRLSTQEIANGTTLVDKDIADKVKNLTPTQVSQRLDRIDGMLKGAQDGPSKDALMKEYRALSDKLINKKPNLSVVEGGAQGDGVSRGNLRPTDEPSPRGLSANAYNPEVFTTAGKAQNASMTDLNIRDLVRSGIDQATIEKHIAKGNKYVVVDRQENKIVDGATNLKTAITKTYNRDKKYGGTRYYKMKIDE